MAQEHVVSALERMNEGARVIMRAREKARMYESLQTSQSARKPGTHL